MFTAAHDLKMEWVVIKGVSDYADGTASSTKHWRPFASVMAASVVNNILREPVVFEQWPHYQTNGVRESPNQGTWGWSLSKDFLIFSATVVTSELSTVNTDAIATCRRIAFDAIMPFVYTTPKSFWKRCQKWNTWKTYG